MNIKCHIEKLDELTALAESSSDTMLQLRLYGFKDAGVMPGLKEYFIHFKIKKNNKKE